jgi:hypothetical protein
MSAVKSAKKRSTRFSVVSFVTIPLSGLFSDHVGRKRMSGFRRDSAVAHSAYMQYGPQAALIAEAFMRAPVLHRRFPGVSAGIGYRRRPGPADRDCLVREF